MKLWGVVTEGGTLDPIDAFAPQDMDSPAGRAAITEDIFTAIDADCTKITLAPIV